MYAHTLKILVLALALVAQAAFAKDPELPPALPGFKMGMEVELLPEKLANLTVLFDFEKLEENTAKFEKGISQLLERTANRYKKFYASEGDISKNYLRNAPSAFRQLPPELQAKLSEGLNLKSKVLADAPQLLGAEGKPLEKKAGFILPGAAKISGLQAAPQKLILPDAAALPAKTAPPVDASLFQSSGSLEVPNRLEWEKLYKRWEELPVETRNSVVKLDLLGPKEKAIVMFEAATWGNEMPLKESLSKEDKDLFSRLKWEGDGDALEFKHKKPVESPEQFVADLRRFAKRAQIEQHIFHPEQPRSDSFHKNAAGEIVEEAKQWGSFHYHYSLEGKDLTLFAEEMNINIFMTRLEQGIYNDLENQRFGFKNIHGKGLMRLVTYDHMEIRAHSEALLNELAKQFGPLFTLNTEAAAQAIAADTKARMTPAVVEKLGRSPYAFLLKRYNPPHEQVIQELERKIRNPSQAAEAAGTLLELKPESKALEKYMESLVKDPKTAVATLTGPQAGVIGNWVKSLPAERAGKVHLIFASALKSAGQREVETLLSLLSAPSWPSPASSEVMKEFNSFLFGLKMGRAGAQKSELVLDFGKKYYSGNLDFLPALEFVLNNRRDTQIQIKTEAALLEMYPHNGEVFAKLGARIFELPSNTDKKMLQAYSFNRVLMQDGERSGSVAKKILMGLGEMDPELKAKFSEWYKNAGKPAENVELGLALGEHDPELRKLAAMDLIKGIDASRPGFADLAYATPHVEIPVLHENLFDCDAAFAGVVH